MNRLPYVRLIESGPCTHERQQIVEMLVDSYTETLQFLST